MFKGKTALLFTLTITGSFSLLNAIAQTSASGQSTSNQTQSGAGTSTTSAATSVINPGNYTQMLQPRQPQQTR